MNRTDILLQSILALVTGIALGSCAGASNPFENAPRPARSQTEAEVPYGTQDRGNLLGAVSAVPMDETQHAQDVIEMLRAHVPGLQVTELPNGDITLRIRGQQQGLRTDEAATQPLLVIDGMPILPSTTSGAFRGLVPSQIESIQVLKDIASTAIYGQRGANGVILIRMKRGG